MDSVIRDLESAGAYIDDLVIYSETWEQHLEHLRTVLTQLRDANLTAKAKKCKFEARDCIYLGHIVGSGLVKSVQDKTQAVNSFKRPCPDFNLPFTLQTDASDKGVGAVLSQISGEGQEHPVAYWSRKLLDREQRYATVEKECLAIKLATEAFRVYLMGRHFTIVTDHHACTGMDGPIEDLKYSSRPMEPRSPALRLHGCSSSWQ